jgi:PrcB C-terminal
VLFVAAVACGGASAVTDAQNIPFTDHGSTQQSDYEGGTRIVVAPDPGGTGLGQLVSRDATRLYIAVFAGSQRTGGYDIRVARIDRAGSTITVRATFVTPASGALTIQVLTSPAQLVSIERQSAASARDVVLVDQSGAERARGTVPQSQP